MNRIGQTKKDEDKQINRKQRKKHKQTNIKKTKK